MVVWNGMDLICLVAAIIITCGATLLLLLMKIGDSSEKRTNKRSEKYWKEHDNGERKETR